MREDDRVVVDVDDAGVGGDALGDLVGVLGGGQARADVEVLADACPAGEVGHGAAEERPVGARHFADAGVHGGDVVADLFVHLVVVLAAEPVVPHAGVVRDVVRGPLPRLLPALLAHVLSLTSVVP